MVDKTDLKRRAEKRVESFVAHVEEMAAQIAEQRMRMQGATIEELRSDEEWEQEFDLATAAHLRKTGGLN